MSETLATPAEFELGRSSLLEITPAETIGEPAGSIDEGDGVITVYFDTTMAGYKGWRWTVSIARIDGGEPSVLETELTPGETALLSPDWVPWADRLADYKAGQAEQAADELDGDVDGSDDDDDDDDFDEDDVNDDDEALLHSGDLDGVDIDSLDDDDDDDEDEEDDEDDESDDFDESAPAVGVDQSEQSENEPGDTNPNPPAVGRGKQRGKKQDGD